MPVISGVFPIVFWNPFLNYGNMIILWTLSSFLHIIFWIRALNLNYITSNNSNQSLRKADKGFKVKTLPFRINNGGPSPKWSKLRVVFVIKKKSTKWPWTALEKSYMSSQIQWNKIINQTDQSIKKERNKSTVQTYIDMMIIKKWCDNSVGPLSERSDSFQDSLKGTKVKSSLEN